MKPGNPKSTALWSLYISYLSVSVPMSIIGLSTLNLHGISAKTAALVQVLAYCITMRLSSWKRQPRDGSSWMVWPLGMISAALVWGGLAFLSTSTVQLIWAFNIMAPVVCAAVSVPVVFGKKTPPRQLGTNDGNATPEQSKAN